MSLFNRIKNIIKKPEPAAPEKTPLTLAPGDIVEISFVTYEITGKTNLSERNTSFLTLRDGNTFRYLKIEGRETFRFALYSEIDGRLDSPNEIPTTIELDDRMYYLDEQYNGRVTAVGQTPFSVSGEQYSWDFQTDQRELLRIEWQDGRMMMYEGESVLPADVQIIRAT